MVEKKVITKEIFYRKHTLCPLCKSWENVRTSRIFIVTSEGKDFVDKLNSAHCDACKWNGKVLDLLEDVTNG